MITGILVLALTGFAPDSGYLTVRSNVPGMTVYLDGDWLGQTPVEMVPLKPGEQYLVSIVSNDSLERLYWRLRESRLGRKVSTVWTLAAINAGSYPVRVNAGRVTEVMIDYGQVASARREAKLITWGVTGGLFTFGAVLGLVIGALAF